MSSLLDVAKAMNAEAAGNVSLVDVARAERGSDGSKPLSLMDVAKQETPKQTLQQLAQEMDKEDRSRMQVALEATAREVKAERQELRSQALQHTAAEVNNEEQQAGAVLQAKAAAAGNSKQEVVGLDSKEEDDEEDGYSSFEDDDTPKKSSKKEPADEEPADEEETYDPPPHTTPSESKESKEFLRAVYRADKYQIRDMLDSEVVDASIADQVRAAEHLTDHRTSVSRPSSLVPQHGWSGLHWAASQNHADILKLLLQKGAQVNAIDQVRPLCIFTCHLRSPYTFFLGRSTAGPLCTSPSCVNLSRASSSCSPLAPSLASETTTGTPWSTVSRPPAGRRSSECCSCCKKLVATTLGDTKQQKQQSALHFQAKPSATHAFSVFFVVFTGSPPAAPLATTPSASYEDAPKDPTLSFLSFFSTLTDSRYFCRYSLSGST
jgi:chemotaxis protein histidine kinase CheA